MSVINGYLIFWMFILLIYSMYRLFRKKSLLMAIPICAQIFSISIAVLCFLHDVEAEQYVQAGYIILGILPSTLFILLDYIGMVNRIKKQGVYKGLVEPPEKKKTAEASILSDGINDIKPEKLTPKFKSDLSFLPEDVQKNIKRCIIQANSIYAADDYQRRYIVYETLSAVAQESSVLQYNCGYLCYRMKKYRQSLEHFLKAAELHNQNDEIQGEAFYNIGNAYYFMERYDKAAQYFEKAAGLLSNDIEAVENLAFSFVKAGERDKGIEALKRIPSYGGNFRAHFISGKLLLEAEKYDEAEEEFKKAISLCPDSTEAREECARTLLAKHLPDKALVMYSEILKLDRNNYTAWYGTANILAGMHKWREAAESYKKALEIKPESYKAYYNLGIALEEIGKRKEAIEAYRRSIERCPDFIEAYNNLGIALSLSGDHNEALEIYERAIEKMPSDSRLYFNMGMCLYEMECFPQAAAAFRDALEINPEELEIYYYLGAVLMEMRHYNDAIDAYRSALKIKPSDSELHYNIAAIYAILGRYDIAEENLKQAFSLNSSIRDDVLSNRAFDGMRNRKEFKEMVS